MGNQVSTINNLSEDLQAVGAREYQRLTESRNEIKALNELLELKEEQIEFMKNELCRMQQDHDEAKEFVEQLHEALPLKRKLCEQAEKETKDICIAVSKIKTHINETERIKFKIDYDLIKLRCQYDLDSILAIPNKHF